MKISSYALPILLVLTVPAFAGVTISSPSNGDHVSSPFTLSASSTTCSDQPVTTMGYSIDDSGETTLAKGNTTFDESVSTSAGTHTVHVKALGDKGAVCVTDVAVTVSNVTDDVSADTSTVPSGAVHVSSIQSMGNWKATKDSGTGGSASGKTGMVGSPSHSGPARGFVTKYKDRGGERYSVVFGDNRTATNFFYDAWVYFTSSASHIANLEMDVNQTMSNGQTVIFGIQCSGYTGTWEYTENLGSASHAKGHWAATHASCKPDSWSKNKWHHVQMSYSRSSSGHITYKSVWFDGVEHKLNVTVFGARSMGWDSSLVTNFQVDGDSSSGTSTVYLGALTISRW